MTEPAGEHRLLDEGGGVASVGDANGAGRHGLVEELEQQGRDGGHRRLHPLGVAGGQVQHEVHDRKAVVRTPLTRLLLRDAPLVETHREGMEAFERLRFCFGDTAEVVGGLFDRLVEQCQQEVVLAFKVLVEAP